MVKDIAFVSNNFMTGGDIDLQALVAQFSNRDLPPVTDWNPAVERRIDMRIDRTGKWYYNGSAIERTRMVALFSTILRKDKENYYLVTPQEKLQIVVEKVPFVVLLLNVIGAGNNQKLEFTDNVGNIFTAGADHRLWMEQDGDQSIPYVIVRNELAALLARPVYYQLAELVLEVDGAAGVWSDGEFFPLE